MTRIFLASALLIVCGCSDADPYYRADVWQPTGANSGNIAAMLARPNDLILGRGQAALGDSYQQTGAVERVWQDKTKPLTSSSSGPSTGGSR